MMPSWLTIAICLARLFSPRQCLAGPTAYARRRRLSGRLAGTKKRVKRGQGKKKVSAPAARMTMVALQRVWHLDSVPVLGSEVGTVAVMDAATKVLDVCEP